MTTQDNSIDSLIKSFKTVCSSLELNAEFNLKEIEKECGKEFADCAKSLQTFNEIMYGISETCAEVANCSDILKYSTRQNSSKKYIKLPYDLHSDFVSCIQGLYNMSPVCNIDNEDKIVNEKNKQLLDELIKTGEKNVIDLKDIESAIAEAREL